MFPRRCNSNVMPRLNRPRVLISRAAGYMKRLEKNHPYRLKHRYELEHWRKFMPHLRFTNIEQPKKESLMESLDRVIESGDGAEVKVAIDNKLFKCHLMVLRTWSSLFEKSQIESKMLEMANAKVTAKAFEIVYTWMTQMDCECPRSQILDVLIAAQFLQADRLVASIFDCLSDKNNFCEIDAFHLFMEARSKNITPVAELMLRRISRSFLLLLTTKEYRELSVQHLCYMLDSNNLGVQTEIEVFYGALIWIYHDFEARKNDICRVLSAVRFKLMPSHYLLYWAEKLHELELEIADALCPLMHLAMIYQQELHIRTFNADEMGPFDRVWLRDASCLYRKFLDQDKPIEITFELFLANLTRIQKASRTFVSRVVEVEFVFDDESDKEEDSSLLSPAETPHTNESQKPALLLKT
ncbi:kelch-like protein 40b [Scaptodrosophila lebanonensis]|uniref:Kelch-like protein 40b n=1 Tax=Drosophila lebanonensis TaxID=7225 RepID=A0A6J2U2G1_DROLE|nr:kelch-like protein 40b [Scaptodrosophila lebanonensis]